MTARARLEGVSDLSARLRALGGRQQSAVTQAIAESARDLRDRARALISEAAGAGAPSDPGDPPQSRSGRLAASLAAEVAPDGLTARVGTHLDYGAFLEFGTNRMAARPWLQPAFDAEKPLIRRRLVAAMRSALRAGGRP